MEFLIAASLGALLAAALLALWRKPRRSGSPVPDDEASQCYQALLDNTAGAGAEHHHHEHNPPSHHGGAEGSWSHDGAVDGGADSGHVGSGDGGGHGGGFDGGVDGGGGHH